MNRSVFIGTTSLLTGITLAGGIPIIFLAVRNLDGVFNPHMPISVALLLFALLITGITFISGALWALGLAFLTRKHQKGLVWKSGLVWSMTMALSGVILYVAQIPGASIDRTFPTISIHSVFLLAFVPFAALAAGINTRLMISRLGFEELKKETGRKCGIAAGLAFLATSLILQWIFGWEVGGPLAGYRYSMLSIMYVCNAGAALAGGAVLGLILAGQQGERAGQNRYIDRPEPV